MTENTRESLRSAAQQAIIAGDTVGARNILRQLLDLNPNDVTTLLALAKLLPVVSERQRLINQALSLSPNHPDVQAAAQQIAEWTDQGIQIVAVPRKTDTQQLEEPLPPSPPPVNIIMCPDHPDTEATLRCTSCDRPVCVRCAIPNEVGQLCKNCRTQRIPERYRTNIGHHMIGFLVGYIAAAILPLPVLFVISIPFLGPFIFLAAGALAGNLAARVSERLSQKRGRQLAVATSIGVGLGMASFLLLIGALTQPFMLMLGVIYVVVAIRGVQQGLL
ncbi:MAG: B-box zinc finger protein [Roseiflexaceae bacterium]